MPRQVTPAVILFIKISAFIIAAAPSFFLAGHYRFVGPFWEWGLIILGIPLYFAAKAALAFLLGYVWGRQDVRDVRQIVGLPFVGKQDIIDNASSIAAERFANSLKDASTDVGFRQSDAALLKRAEELGRGIQLEFYNVVERYTAPKYGNAVGGRLAAALANYVFRFGFVAPTHIGDQSLRDIFSNEGAYCLSLFGDKFKTNATGVLILLGAAWQVDFIKYKAHMRWLANCGFIKSGKNTPNVGRELAASDPAYMYCIALDDF